MIGDETTQDQSARGQTTQFDTAPRNVAERHDGDPASAIDLSTATLADPQLSKCPFSYYRAMREQDPVHRDPSIGYWWIAKREDVIAAAQDPAHFSSNTDLQFRSRYRPRAQALWDAAGIEVPYTILTSDPPEHEEYRRFAMSLFTPKRVNELTPHIADITNELIDDFIDSGRADFAKEFAELLPATIVCDEYGFPRADRSRFKSWADSILLLQTPGISEDEEVTLVTRVIELFKYLTHHLELQRDKGDGRVIYDLVSINRKDGTPFTLMERAWMAMTIFIGGVDTTANTLVSCINHLCLHPELQDQLRGKPDEIGNFFEEILRLHGPVQSIARRAKSDFEYSGKSIAEGNDVMLCLGSANRDETFWEKPDEFRLDRANVRQHLSFGSGRHVCVGMHLARQELQIALSLILDRLENIAFADPVSPPEYLPLPIFRGIASMPIRFSARRR